MQPLPGSAGPPSPVAAPPRSAAPKWRRAFDRRLVGAASGAEAPLSEVTPGRPAAPGFPRYSEKSTAAGERMQALRFLEGNSCA